MTRVLDIVQDMLDYKQYPYERLDGSVRGDERHNTIKNFKESEDSFVFLVLLFPFCCAEDNFLSFPPAQVALALILQKQALSFFLIPIGIHKLICKLR